MTTLTKKRNGKLFPTFADFIETDTFFGPSIFDPEFSLLNQRFPRLPSVNVSESDKDFKLEIAAPGLEKKDFNIEIENGTLTVSAEKEEEKKDNDKNFKRREFSYQTFSRSFDLPENVDGDKIDAQYENGILTLSVPKKEVTVSKPKKQINIK